MSLCTLCISVPFGSLPSTDCFKATALVAGIPALFRHETTSGGVRKPAADPPPPGHPWHADETALAASAAAAGCGLCGLAHAGVRAWFERHDAVVREAAQSRRRVDPMPSPRGQRLWLARRPGGGQGFVVLARGPGVVGEEYVYPVAAVAFAAPPDGPLAGSFLTRPMHPDSGAPQSLDVAAEWLRRCDAGHARCRAAHPDGEEEDVDPPLPSRVLDVGVSGDDDNDDVVRLVDAAGQTGKYLCLSHCWGADARVLTTTRETYDARVRGIGIRELGRTFRDAVRIARRLGVRYLWIDSLCIRQDDGDDWARESERMAEVYSRAHLVVAAGHAADGDGGCFHVRETRQCCNVELPGVGSVVAQLALPRYEVNGLTENAFRKEPLQTRGWALQERALARRVLHYNSSQMYFECNEGIVGEDGCGVSARYCSLNWADAADGPLGHLDMWNSLLGQYGTRKLTKPSDKLPAMSGLAKLMGARMGGGAHYVAGLWSNALVKGLAWQCLGDRAPSAVGEYVGPSWSWAGFAGIPVAHPFDDRYQDVAEVVGWHVDLKNQRNPYGQVSHAWIKIRAPIAELRLSEEKTTDHEIIMADLGRTPCPRLLTRYSDKKAGQVVALDHSESLESGRWREWDMHVVILHKYPKFPFEKNESPVEGDEQGQGREEEAPEQTEMGERLVEYYFGLVVAPVDGKGPVMKRVGWIFVPKQDVDRMREDDSCWKTVTLV